MLFVVLMKILMVTFSNFYLNYIFHCIPRTATINFTYEFIDITQTIIINISIYVHVYLDSRSLTIFSAIQIRN